ncbi:hypothetical protein V1264_017727 [Littorina saxatilis]|uniref:Uncharacterized protein n=1 Tax=Littorina saxatilis TaxID=31220 RepID=A0AAN9BJ33_9CAEN
MSRSMVTRTGLWIAALNTLFLILGLAGMVFVVICIFDRPFLKRVLGQVSMCHLDLQESKNAFLSSIFVSSLLCFFLSAAGCLAALFLLRKALVIVRAG